HSNRFDTRVQVSVNGGPPVEVLLPESNTWDWRHTHWRNTRVENLWLEPGTENTLSLTVEALRDLAIDEILVSTADDLAKAAPHRQVLSLEPADLDQLITFLRELDGSPYIPPVPAEPVVQVLPAPGQTDPFFSDTARFDIRFDRPIQGLETGDFVLSGSAAANELVLMEIDPGRLYRAEVGGHFLSGSITLQLPAGSVTASGTPVPASQVASIQFHSPYPEVDDLAPLSDEFSGASSLADWRRRAVDEGWGIDQLETWNIDQSRSGHMRLVPHGSG
ncbi:MAG: hypothetical protein GWO24_24115, partial [Akkermansiaceae bacterium]|nr:hypothetical protein [Akkermansiaceae bacterium]